MSIHSFVFSVEATFLCSDPESHFTFYASERSGRFHWTGAALDKLGHYNFVPGDVLYLDLEWNYGREARYIILSWEGNADALATFTMKDTKSGKHYTFSRKL